MAAEYPVCKVRFFLLMLLNYELKKGDSHVH